MILRIDFFGCQRLSEMNFCCLFLPFAAGWSKILLTAWDRLILLRFVGVLKDFWQKWRS